MAYSYFGEDASDEDTLKKILLKMIKMEAIENKMLRQDLARQVAHVRDAELHSTLYPTPYWGKG